MLFDDSLGSINTGKTILTAYVKANFKAPMRPLCTYYLVGKLDRIEGRKIFSTGTIQLAETPCLGNNSGFFKRRYWHL